jgi:RNA polymerase sigma-70 factor, ECF subfamily
MASGSSETPPLESTDGALAMAAVGGDPLAFRSLVHRYGPDCARYALRLLGHRHDAEDAVQETWYRAYRALPRYEERDVFKRWLFRILINVCRTMRERRARQSRRFIESDDMIAHAPDPTADRPDRATVEDLISGLDPRAREALLLKFGERLEYAEMARLTGDSISALKMRVKRALDTLRPALGASE